MQWDKQCSSYIFKIAIAICQRITSYFIEPGQLIHQIVFKTCFPTLQRPLGEEEKAASGGSEDEDYVPYVPVKIRKTQTVGVQKCFLKVFPRDTRNITHSREFHTSSECRMITIHCLYVCSSTRCCACEGKWWKRT